MPNCTRLTRLMALATALVLPTSAQAVVLVFSDAVFADANWSLVELTDTTPNDSAFFSGQQVASGGNPDAYRRLVNELDTNTISSIAAGHLRLGATFDPGEDGSFLSLAVSLDGISQPGNPAGAIGYGVVLEQNGAYFTVGLSQVLDGVGWQTLSATGLGESSFNSVDGVSVLDLSDSGSPVTFGFLSSNGTFGRPSTNVGGVDNWTVTIEATDPPSAVPMLGWPIRLVTLALLLVTAGCLLRSSGDVDRLPS